MPDFEDAAGKDKKKTHPSYNYEPGSEPKKSDDRTQDLKPRQPSAAQKSNLRSRWKPAKRPSSQPSQEIASAKSEDIHIPQKNFIEETNEFQQAHPEAVEHPESLLNEEQETSVVEDKPAYPRRERPKHGSFERKHQPREPRAERTESKPREHYKKQDQDHRRPQQPQRPRPRSLFQAVKAAFFKLLGRVEKEEVSKRPFDQRNKRYSSSRRRGGGGSGKNYNRPRRQRGPQDKHKQDDHTRPPRKQQNPGPKN